MSLIHRLVRITVCLGLGALVYTPEPCSALVIYRIGGEDLPAPPELGSAGVDFEQLPWEPDVEAGGEVFQVALDGGILELLSHDPNVNIAPGWEARGGRISPPAPDYLVAFDGDQTTTLVVPQYVCANSARATPAPTTTRELAVLTTRSGACSRSTVS